MFLNENFLKLWEELSDLNEAKADTEKLINFAGEDLTNRFLAIKSKVKSPENDLYYWLKKTPEELEAFLTKIEQNKSNTQIKKEVAGQGAKLICSTPHWDVYNITTYEAAQTYGRDTKWCITGINNWGDAHWQDYKYQRGVDFYFLITKENYDSRAFDSKFAIALYPDGETYEAFDQKDGQVLIEDIKYIDEIKIPGVDLWALESRGPRCSVCNDFVFNEEGEEDSFGNLYCPTCWNEELHEWVDKNGNKVNIQSPAVSGASGNNSGNTSSSFEGRLEKLYNYIKINKSSKTKIDRIELYSLENNTMSFSVYYNYNTGYIRNFQIRILPNQADYWGITIYNEYQYKRRLYDADEGRGWENLLSAIGKYFSIPARNTPEYNNLLIE